MWSDAYQSWSGDFESLVQTANVILKDLGFDPVSASLVRHYQQRQLVGRGTREGRQSRFDLDDLRAVVETKCMAKEGWKLDQVSLLYASQATDPQGASFEHSAIANQSFGFNESWAEPAFHASSASSSLTPAMKVVDRLMRQSAQVPSSMPLGGSLSLLKSASAPGASALRATAAVQLNNSSSLSGLAQPKPSLQATAKQHLYLGAGLDVSVDVDALKQASGEDVQAALHAFSEWCEHHRTS